MICAKRKLPHPRRAEHFWGGLPFCCGHFDELVKAMYEIHEAVAKQAHDDYVRIFEQRGGKLQPPYCSGRKREPDEGGGKGGDSGT